MVKLMYSKMVTEKIIEYQALGFSAEETKTAFLDKTGKAPCLNTIYKHRRSPVGMEMLRELIRHQERSILKTDNEHERALAMRYRDSLIGKLMDRLMPPVIRQEINETRTLMSKHVEELNVNLATYEDSVQKVIARHLQTNRSG